MIGKITILKALVFPNITFIASNSIISKEHLQEFKNLVYNFLWNGKTDRVKRSTISKKYNEGGLNMTDIETYIKYLRIKWILKLIENKEDNWTILPQFYLKSFEKPIGL